MSTVSPAVPSAADARTVDGDRGTAAPAAQVGPVAAGGRWRAGLGRVAAYVALTKPRIIELLLVTTVPTMILAADGMPDLGLVLATLLGGTAAAGSANALNCVYDRDIDAVMSRTKRRPLVTGEISVRAATVFAIVLGVLAVAWLWWAVNATSALLALGAILLYVVGYTMILKRRTPQNIVWGGIAGCMPVLIGWSAVTGGVDLAPVWLFGVIFFWTPPHYWPLSMRFRRDYAAAGVPMLPVVADDRRVAIEVVTYSVAMVACSLLLATATPMTWVYLAVASAAGGWFLLECVRLYFRAKDPSVRKLREMKVFHLSITYLSVLFLAVAVDPFLPL